MRYYVFSEISINNITNVNSTIYTNRASAINHCAEVFAYDMEKCGRAIENLLLNGNYFDNECQMVYVVKEVELIA